MKFGNSQCGIGRGPLFILLALLLIGAPSLAANIVSVVPAQNALNVPAATNIMVTFDEDMNETTLNNSTILIHSNMTGLHPGVIAFDAPSRTATINPDRDFMVGELVTVVLTTGVESAGGMPLAISYNWSFTIAVSPASTGQYYAGASYTGPNTIECVTGADLDNDGDLDLVSTSIYMKECDIYINDGYGIFSKTVYSNVSATSVLAADFDNDGDIDLAFSAISNGGVFSWENEGGFVFTKSWESDVQDFSFSDVIASDFDCDGFLDLVFSSISDSMFIFSGNGDVTFTRDTAFGAEDVSVISAADFDNDGDVDLAAVHSHTISLYFNQGNGSFGPPQDYDIGARSNKVITADLDGDGDLDLSVLPSDLEILYIMINNGSGSFGPGVEYALQGDPRSETFADIDGDGDLDLLLPNSTSKLINILKNDGSAAFGEISRKYIVGYARDAFAGDIDADGDIDLAIAFPIGNPAIGLLINGPCQDTDNDGFGDPGIPANECFVDNCPFVINPDQADSNSDGTGDVCDPKALGAYGVAVDLGLSDDYTRQHDTLYIGGDYCIVVSIKNLDFIGGMSLGWRLYTDDGISWTWLPQENGYPQDGSRAVTVIPGCRLDPPKDILDMTGLMVTEQNIDGISPDSIIFGGSAMNDGLPAGDIEAMVTLHFSLDDMPGDIGTLCFDSAFIPPNGAFVFVQFLQKSAFPPDYYGPHCWTVKRAPLLGDFDLDGRITVGDVVVMIQVIFKGQAHPIPLAAGDVNCDGQFNVGDAIYLINYIFKYGPAPGCP